MGEEDQSEAYYAQLLARVDDTIGESRSQQAGMGSIGHQLSNYHSLGGMFVYDELDSFSPAKRFCLLSLSVVFIMFMSMSTVKLNVGSVGGFGASWFLITIIWQSLNLSLRTALKRSEFAQKNLIWPYMSVGSTILLTILSVIYIAGGNHDMVKVGFTIFLVTWMTNCLVELPVIYALIITRPRWFFVQRLTSEESLDDVVSAGTVTNL